MSDSTGHLVPPAWLDAHDLDSFAAALNSAKGGEIRLLDPLPWRVRARLWLEGCIDQAGYWLVVHNHDRVAARLWRIFGMWK